MVLPGANQTVTISPPTGKNLAGAESFGTPVTYTRCRVELVSDLVRGVAGEELTRVVAVYIEGAATVTPAYRVTLPDGSTPLITLVEKLYGGGTSVHHTRILLKG